MIFLLPGESLVQILVTSTMATQIKTADNVHLLVEYEGEPVSMIKMCTMTIISSTFEELLQKLDQNGAFVGFPNIKIANLDDACIGYVRRLNEEPDITMRLIDALFSLAISGVIGSTLMGFANQKITLDIVPGKSCSQIVRAALAKRKQRRVLAIFGANAARLVALYALLRVENSYWPVFWTTGCVPLLLGSLIKYFI